MQVNHYNNKDVVNGLIKFKNAYAKKYSADFFYTPRDELPSLIDDKINQLNNLKQKSLS